MKITKALISSTYIKVLAICVVASVAAYYLLGPLAGIFVLVIGLPIPLLAAGWFSRG